MDEYISSLKNENNQLKLENEKLIQHSKSQDEYINKLNEKLSYLEKCVFQNQKEEQKKHELFDIIINTKENLNILKQLYKEKYSQLQHKYLKLREQFEEENNNHSYYTNDKHSSNEKIKKHISKINKVT